MTDTADAVIEAIRRAFIGVPHGGTTLHEAEVIDRYGTPEERAAARLLDTNGSWDLVPDSHVEECSTALCHLDPEGWRHYIPAYMIWSLRHFRVSDSIVSDFTIYTFAPSESDPDLRECSLTRYRLLDVAQSQAVCRFLRHMAANSAYADSRVASMALAQYWGQFCDTQDTEQLRAPEPAG